MKQWLTQIKAVDPQTGDLVEWLGPYVPGETSKLAAHYCNENGMGYCQIVGQVVAEIPTLPDGVTPDYAGRVDFDTEPITNKVHSVALLQRTAKSLYCVVAEE
ncbi:hypothetical protein A6C57_01130 [Fibrella sp. ES10-3-2-2]|nr:hypothetical protein A6C57_01130 [Fibrella sp. ES10-3-2-2]